MTGQGPAEFWLGIAGEHGCLLGAAAEALAMPGVIESFQDAVSKIDRAETVGPILDPTFWARSPNAFGRAALCRALLEAAIAFGGAERKRRAEWDGAGVTPWK